MNAQEARTVADFLAADFEREMQTTQRVIAAIPADRASYKPDAKSKSALGLARHITLEDEWLLTSVATGQFTRPPDDSDACGIMNPADALARYKERIPAALARVRALPDEKLIATIDMFGQFQLPAINFLALALKHSVHHRGQLSTYLRPMGGAVPGIYGPSADTKQE